LIRSRRCSVANTSSSRLATFFMVYTIVINYTVFVFEKSRIQIFYIIKESRVYFYVSKLYIF
jgi:hypothetical protein